MLNLSLYKTLVNIFGDDGVSITHVDEPGIISGKPTQGSVSIVGGEKYNVKCPICEDTEKKRLAFSYACNCDILVKKWKRAVHIPYLYRCVHEECQQRPELRHWLWSRGVFNCTDKPIDLRKFKIQHKDVLTLAKKVEIPLPKDARAIISSEVPAHALRYVLERRYDPWYLYREFNVNYAVTGTTWDNRTQLVNSGKYDLQNGEDIDEEQLKADVTQKCFKSDHILYPLCARNKQMGWQARSINSYTNSNYRYYLECQDLTSMLYNMDKAKFCDGTLIVEGAPDVWRSHLLTDHGISGVGLLSKGFNLERARLCEQLWGYETNWACIMLDSPQKDPQSPEDAQAIAKMLLETGAFPAGICISYLPEQDPDSYNPKDLLTLIHSSVMVPGSKREMKKEDDSHEY